jgi:S1-C subfamily serine protease
MKPRAKKFLIFFCLVMFVIIMQDSFEVNQKPIFEETYFTLMADVSSRWDSRYKTNCSPDFLQMRQATVEIKVGNTGGAGAIVKMDDKYLYVLTAQHCIGNNMAMQIKDINGDIYRVFDIPNSNIIMHKDVDLALIKVPKPLATFRKFMLAKPPALVGTDIYTIGHPANTYYSVNRGIVSSYTERTYNNHKEEYLLVSAPSWGGNSGGAIVNSDTELVGIAVGILYVGNDWKDYKNNVYLFYMTYAVTLEKMYEFLTDNGIF